MNSRLPILTTKILIPRRREDILPRPRLIQLLSEWMDARLIIVAAPAGYGKTSLLVDFAATEKLPVCWLSLDAYDQDLQRFCAHLIASVQRRFEAFGRTSMAAIENLDQQQISLESLASLIANDLYEATREHFAIVLDDYHLIEDSRAVTGLLNQLIQSVDENCHFMIASRTLLNLPDMPLLVARSQVTGLSFEELAFQPDEIRELWLRNFHQHLSESEVARLASETEGWITGLLLSRQARIGQIGEKKRSAQVAGVGLYEYLARQVLERQPTPMQQFLLRTSLLEEFDADLCQKVIGPLTGGENHWPELITAALHANLFIQPIGEDPVFLRYHHLFRDFLQDRMKRLYPLEAEQIQLNLARIWTERGEWERSYQVYRQLGRVEEMARLIEQAGADLIARGQITTLAEWLGALPQAVQARPTLLSLKGAVAVINGRSEEGVSLLTEANRAFEQTNDLFNLARTLTRKATAHKLAGQYGQSLDDMHRAYQIARQLPEAAAVAADALAGIGSAHFHLGNLAESQSWLVRSIEAFEQIGDEESVAKTSMQLGVVARALGDFPGAERAYRKALQYYEARGNLIWQGNVLNNLGVLQHGRGAFEEAASSFEKAIQYARIGGFIRLEAYALVSLGDLYRDLGAFEEAQDAYRQARPIALRVNDRFLTFYLDLMEASLSRQMNHIEHAQRLIEVSWQAANQSGSAYQVNLCRLERGRLATSRNDYASAVTDLAEALTYFEQEGRRAESMVAHLYLAVVHASLKHRDAAFSHIQQVSIAALDENARTPVLVAGREVRDPLAALRSDDLFERPVASLLVLIEAFEQRIPALRRHLRQQSQMVASGPPRLILHTLGRVQVKVNGHTLTLTDWTTQSTRDLFLLLVFHPEGLTKEEIGAILWPDATPDELKIRFKNYIYRVRRAVGKEAILFEDEIYRFNRSLDYEEDSEIFQRELELAARARDIEQKIHHYRAALKVYRGVFLPDLKESWVLPERQRLYQRYMDALLRLGTLELERRQFDAALNCVERMLAEDACLEDAYRLGMLTHASRGNRAGVIRLYETCARMLQEEYGTPPSPQTQQLYQSLIR